MKAAGKGNNPPRARGSRGSSMLLKILFAPSDEGGYTASVPALPGCLSEGDTLEEARHNIREAIALYLEPDEDLTPPEGGFAEEIAV
jgi:predicted RNase H-like HicB family nuclease